MSYYVVRAHRAAPYNQTYALWPHAKGCTMLTGTRCSPVNVHTRVCLRVHAGAAAGFHAYALWSHAHGRRHAHAEDFDQRAERFGAALKQVQVGRGRAACHALRPCCCCCCIGHQRLLLFVSTPCGHDGRAYPAPPLRVWVGSRGRET